MKKLMIIFMVLLIKPTILFSANPQGLPAGQGPALSGKQTDRILAGKKIHIHGTGYYVKRPVKPTTVRDRLRAELAARQNQQG
ncbi:MAG TPA: hypothetical protein VGT41_00380 [Candidatus Babeliales bacterium]|nr:hypothetical protein [Candidatus Babeliales bacterium]